MKRQSIHAPDHRQGTPTAATGDELEAIAAAVVGGASLFGGRGTILGCLIGALLFTTIGNGADLLAPYSTSSSTRSLRMASAKVVWSSTSRCAFTTPAKTWRISQVASSWQSSQRR